MFRAFLISLTILFVGDLHGQYNPFVFSHVTEKDGLSYNVVNCIMKDSRGLVWIGTYNGFNRYDGANVYPYKIRKGSNSMLNEVVHSLCEDHLGNIWGATDNGVFCYHVKTDTFVNYDLRSMGKVKEFYSIYCDKQGTVYTIGRWSVFRYNRSKNRFDEMFKTSSISDSTGFYMVSKNGIVEDSAKSCLWFTTSYGLICYHIQTNTVQSFKTEPNNPLFKKQYVSSITRSADQRYWFFDHVDKTIVRFDPGSQQVIQQINLSPHMEKPVGATLFEDSKHRLWFSSWSYEIIVIDQQANNTVYKLKHDPENNRSIAGDFFWSVYQDADNTIWAGTVAGISRCNPEQNLYREMRLGDFFPELKHTIIRLVEENPLDHSFWIVTKDNIYLHVDFAKRTYQRFFPDQALPNSQKAMPGYCNIIRFYQNQVIFSTFTGSWKLEPGDKKLKPFQYLPPGYEQFVCCEVAHIGDSIWYYNNSKELLYWNKPKGISRLLKLVGDSINEDMRIGAMHISKDQKAWVLTRNNYFAEEIDHQYLKQINIVKDRVKEAGAFSRMVSDHDDHIWILNKGAGLYAYHRKTKEVQVWNETDGLVGNRSQHIVVDSFGRIWNMLYDKVSVFMPATNSFYNFSIPYSEGNLAYNNHQTVLSNGNPLGCIYDELVEFFPERLLLKPAIRKPLISSVQTKNATISVWDNQTITLQPDDNTIRLKFGSTSCDAIFSYDIEYKLEGAEEAWTTAGKNREALYNNLASGTYTFLVRATGKQNNWQSETASLRILIRTPFYKTTWFLLIVLIMLAMGIYLFYKNRLAQKEKLLSLETKAQALEKEKAMVMYENLKQHLNPHFLFNSLTSLSSLIRIDQHMAGDFLDKMSKVYRYILKNRDNEVVPLQDELKFVQLYIDLQKTRFEEGLVVRVQIPDDSLHRKVAPVTLQNLIENAIKHNTTDIDSPLCIELFIHDDYLVVRNNLQKKKFVETSNRQGLANMESLYQYLSNRPMLVQEDQNHFTVKIPLL